MFGLRSRSCSNAQRVARRADPSDWGVAERLVRTDAVGYIDATAARVPPIRPALLRAVDALEATALGTFDTAFAELEHDQRYELLTGLEADNPRGVFDLVLELTYEAYYRDQHVLDILERRTGFSMRRTMEGWDMEPFDERLLERARALPPRVRSVSA